jgi:glycine C-acetyltransferase
MAFTPSDFSLADFFLPDAGSTDATVPSDEFIAWRQATAWATQLYEPVLDSAPGPRTHLHTSSSVRPVVNLTSSNYLGLATHPGVVAAADKALREFGAGACGSPLLSGITRLHRQFERRLADFLGHEAVLLFSSGFSGAVACMAGLLRRGDVAVLDSKAHISLAQGARLSGARVVEFAHNEAESLHAVLAATAGSRRLVVLDGLYSMDGDLAALPAILDVTEAHDVPVFVDDAHAVLACGEHGRGAADSFGLGDRIRLQYGSLSKAFAGLGGFVAGPAATIDYLRCFATAYGFAGALPPATVAGLTAALDAGNDAALRARLWDNASYFRGQLNELGIDTGLSSTYVVPLLVGSDRTLLYELGLALRDRGLFLTPVDYPSVPQDQVRFRASITAAHTRADLDEALNVLEDTAAALLRDRRRMPR